MATLTAPTLSTLITNIRLMLGEPSATNSRWTDAELEVYINEGIRRYFGEVIQNSEGLFAKTTDLNITKDSETIALPSDFFELVRVYRKTSGNNYIHMPYDNSFQESYSADGNSGGDSYIASYRLRDNSLVLRPVPGFNETAGIKIEYISFPTTMDVSADTLPSQVSPVFQHLIEMYATWKAKLAETMRSNGTSVHATAAQQLGDAYKQFQNVIQERAHSPEFIKQWDTDFFNDGN